MKQHLLLIALLLLGLTTTAQNQQGYVKTKGRMVNGQLVPGQGLPGALVAVKGHTAMLVNNNDGSFSFPVTAAQFRLDSVSKKGYQLVDAETCPKNYTYSTNPLYILMETPEQQLQDQLDAERKIRRNLQKQLQAKEDELEALKGSGKLSAKDYQKALQKLYAQQEDNERLINDMAKRYATLDYDQLDAFYRQVTYFIESGELLKADSMLNSRGDIGKQVSEIRQHGQVLHEKHEALQQAEAVQRADVHEAANRCYNYYLTAFMQRLNDTAAYYLELRASLDTNNLEWSNLASRFIHEYLADRDRALPYYQRMLRIARNEYGENSDWVATCYGNLGSVYDDQRDFDKAMQYYDKAFVIRMGLYGPNHPDVATCYNNKALVCLHQDQYEKALEYLRQALRILLHNYGEHHPLVAICYNNMAQVYGYLEDYDNAGVFLDRALDLNMEFYGTNSPEIAAICNSIGTHFLDLGDYEFAFDCFSTALEIWTVVYGLSHPAVKTAISNIGTTYLLLGIAQGDEGDYDASLESLKQALEILTAVHGEDDEIVTRTRETIQVMQSAKENK